MLTMVCDAFEDEDPSVQVLVDNEIHPNTEWFPKINEWMLECHAAIILMSEEALNDSNWVKSEAAVLCARRRSDPKFKLITIPINSVTPENITEQSFFGTIRLTDFQLVRDCADNEERINKTKDLLAGYNKVETPFQSLLIQIRQILRTIENETLTEVWENMSGVENIRWQPDASHEDCLARELIRNPSLALSDLRGIIERLAPTLSQGQANNLLEILKGIWVHSQAASFLSLSRENNQNAAINSFEIEDFTGHCYARRVWPYPQEITLVSAGDKRTFPEIEQILIEQVGKSALNERRKKKRLINYKHPLLLLFPYQEGNDRGILPTEDLLEEIKREYSNITILLATGSEIPDYLTYALPLEPLLETDQEGCQCGLYEDVAHYIKKHLAA